MNNYNYTAKELSHIGNISKTVSIQLTDFEGNKTKFLGLNDTQSLDTLINFLNDRKKYVQGIEKHG